MTRALAAAYAYAAHMHARQFIKGDPPETYLVHVCDVADYVARVGADETTLIAAVLHDVLEDTPAERAEIVERFGEEAAALIGWLTDDPAISDLPTSERKARQAEKIAAAPDAAKRIKVADQLDNIEGRARAFDQWPMERHRVYLAGARQVVEACRAAEPELAAQFDAAADRLETALDAAARPPR